jgi:hypothetical protein
MDSMLKEHVYRENSQNYRFFLTWRHAALGGHLVIMWAILSVSVQAFKEAHTMLWIIPLAGVPFALAFWAIDYRIRKLFRCAVRVGRLLEEEINVYGFFRAQCEVGTLPAHDHTYPKFLSHTFILGTIYLGSAVLLVCLSIYFKFH